MVAGQVAENQFIDCRLGSDIRGFISKLAIQKALWVTVVIKN